MGIGNGNGIHPGMMIGGNSNGSSGVAYTPILPALPLQQASGVTVAVDISIEAGLHKVDRYR
jgi:hypothetical protein